MINVTFIGNIFHSDGTPATDVRYQALFIKNNPNSSNTIWDTSRLSETNQYNLNLGDNTWLSQQSGYAQPYDKVLLCFWLSNTEARDSLALTEWCFIEWILDDRDVYIQDIQLQAVSTPTCSFAVSGNNPLILYDTGSTDDSQWIYSGKDHYQAYLWDGYEIFQMNKFIEPAVTIEWGDTVLESLALSSSPYGHTYASTNDYQVVATLTNSSSLSCSAQFDHRVINEVVNGLNWSEPVVMGNTKSYIPNITGNIVGITGVDYYIDGSLSQSNLAYNQSFWHTFVDAGNHTIRQCIKYNDGFDIQIQCEDYIVQIASSANYVSNDYECGLIFTDASIIGNPPIVKYQWDVTDGLFILSHVEGAAYHDWYYAWPYRGTFRVRLAVTDSNNRTTSLTKEFEVTECIGGTGDGGGGGGGSSPWVYAETKYITKNEPLPVVHIINIDDTDNDPGKNKKILIKEINEYDSIL